MTIESVPLVDLAWQHAIVGRDISEGFEQLFERSSYILGPEVADFEERFAAYCGVLHCVGVANGTDALELILRALGVRPGDEVILPANTFAATALAVLRAGARPVFADCDDQFLLLDPADVAARTTSRVKVVIPVHLFGQMAPVEEIQSAVGPHVLVVEDAAQAHGAEHDGRKACSIGVAAGTSFYPGKNLGAYGDAGAVLTSNEAVATSVTSLRNYGSRLKYHHESIGFNSRLDSLQAVVLTAKLKHLDEWNLLRSQAAGRYNALLEDLEEAKIPAVAPKNLHAWHLYVVRVPRRDEVLAQLRAAGIGAGIHYPLPLHLQPAFRFLGCESGDFPIAEAAAQELLSLPLFPGISEDQQERVAAILRKVFR